MKNLILIFSLFNIATNFVNGQIQLDFNSCYISERENPDSNFYSSSYFEGIGSIEIFEDSIIIKYSNEWESGTYLMHIESLNQFKDGDEFITNFSGTEEYQEWIYDLYVIRNSLFSPKAVIFDTEYLLTEDDIYSTKRRVYSVENQKRKVIDSIE